MFRKPIIFSTIFLMLIFGSGCSLNNNKASISDINHKSQTAKNSPSVSPIATTPTLEPTVAPMKNIAGVPVLMYHSIMYEKDNHVRMPKEMFNEQMKYLKDNGYKTISLEELYAYLKKDAPLPDKPIVITLDDGYEDNYSTAFPILKAYGFKAVIFIITNKVDKNSKYITLAQQKEMLAAGIEIESHTVSHQDLNTLSSEKQLVELEDSKSFLQKVLNIDVKYLAYPYGHYNSDTLKCVAQANYVMAFTTEKGWVTKNNSLSELPRVYISSFFSMEVFKERVTNPHYNTDVPTDNKVTPLKSETAVAVNLNALYDKGYKLFKAKKYKEAIEVEDNVIKNDPTFYKAYNVKGIAICFSSSFDEGMKYINKALQLKPDYGYARFNKALAYELYRNFDKALLWYDKALEVEKYVWSYYGKASIYGRSGDVANSVKFLKEAISIDTYAKTCAKTEKDFDNVRGSKEFQALIG